MRDIVIKILLILLLMLMIFLCMPTIAESETVTAAMPEPTPTPDITPTPAPAPTEAISYAPAPLPTPNLMPTPAPTPEPYSEAEKQIIAKVVYAEARGECFEGQIAVAQVVINRYESGRFGKSIRQVAYAKHQFAVGKKYNDESMRAVEEAIETRPLPDNTYYFSRGRKHYGEWYCTIGAHNFFVD